MKSANNILSKNSSLFACLMKPFSLDKMVCNIGLDDIEQEGQSFVDFLLHNKLLMRFYNSVDVEALNLKNEASRVLTDAIETEKQRQENLVVVMSEICGILSDSGVDYVVVKTIDGYPDVGKDIDIVVMGNYEKAVRELVTSGFKHSRLPSIRKNCKKFYKQKNGFIVTVDLYDKQSTLIGETINLESIQNSKEICFRDIGRSSIPVPSPEVSFLIKMDELYLNGRLSLGDLYTLAKISAADNFDWEYVLDVVEDAGTSIGFVYVLMLLNQNLELANHRSDIVDALNLNQFTKWLLTRFSKPEAFPTKIAPAVILQMWTNKAVQECVKKNALNSMRCYFLLLYLLYKNALFQFLGH